MLLLVQLEEQLLVGSGIRRNKADIHRDPPCFLQLILIVLRQLLRRRALQQIVLRRRPLDIKLLNILLLSFLVF